jgi:hypothetical protein
MKILQEREKIIGQIGSIQFAGQIGLLCGICSILLLIASITNAPSSRSSQRILDPAAVCVSERIFDHPTGFNGGIMTFASLNLSGHFEIKFEVDLKDDFQRFSLTTHSGQEISVSFLDDGIIRFENMKWNWDDTEWKGGQERNNLRLVVRDGVVHLLINDVVIGSVDVPQDIFITDLAFSGFEGRNYLYFVEILRC